MSFLNVLGLPVLATRIPKLTHAGLITDDGQEILLRRLNQTLVKKGPRRFWEVRTITEAFNARINNRRFEEAKIVGSAMVDAIDAEVEASHAAANIENLGRKKRIMKTFYVSEGYSEKKAGHLADNPSDYYLATHRKIKKHPS
jgi:hypothetical protein